jgi:dTDP-4-amino-4,6-dideoxygalactose transaminase
MERMKEKNIYITQPNLPDLDGLLPDLRKIWESKILTNNGPYHHEFENALKGYLKAPNVGLFANGTLALLTGLKALELTGDVITTPYSFPATAHAIVWNDLTPVFVDIDPHTFSLDPDKIREKITSKTSAILAVHVYGIPGHLEEYQAIADEYGLKLIYDAAHAFGVKYKGADITSFGDMSMLSFHATKLFNTFEGGALIFKDNLLKPVVESLKNFAIINEEVVNGVGINSKLNEFQALVGLHNLEAVSDEITKRKCVAQEYRDLLSNMDGIELLKVPEILEWNYSYFPILFAGTSGQQRRDEVYNTLREHNIYARKYFYPLITKNHFYQKYQNSQLNIAEDISKKILCLPIYGELANSPDMLRIENVFKECKR